MGKGVVTYGDSYHCLGVPGITKKDVRARSVAKMVEF